MIAREDLLYGWELLGWSGDGWSPSKGDRYYASTKAYIQGKQIDVDLPSLGDPFFTWPEDLVRPDIMFLLTVNEEERLRRRAGRADVPETADEALLRQNALISERINEVYRRFGCIEIDASGSTQQIVEQMRAVIFASHRGK